MRMSVYPSALECATAVAALTPAVFRNDGISAEYLAQSLSDDASCEVGNSAWRKAKDQMNGLRGELLCPCLKIEGRAKDGRSDYDDRAAITGHSESLRFSSLATIALKEKHSSHRIVWQYDNSAQQVKRQSALRSFDYDSFSAERPCAGRTVQRGGKFLQGTFDLDDHRVWRGRWL